jgi:hypothetical protein
MASRGTAQTRQENEETAIGPWTASHKCRHRSLIYSVAIGKESLGAARRSQHSRNSKTGGMCGQQGRSTNAY